VVRLSGAVVSVSLATLHKVHSGRATIGPVSERSGIAATVRSVDERVRARPRTSAVVYFVVLSTAWAVAEVYLGGESVTVGVLLGGLFGLIYVGLAWFWGDLGEADATE
jgi:hypothetical protein